MRHRDDYATSSSLLLFTSRPSLPRLKNRASLGRLSAYGGVLDFEVSSQVSVVPAVPSFYRGSTCTTAAYPSGLAGPGHSGSSGSQDHNIAFMQHTRSKQHEDQEQQHTPPKNTTQATLRALKMLNREKLPIIDYDTTPTTPLLLPDDGSRRTGIPILDADHPHRLQQTGTADQTGITTHSQSRLAHGISTLPTPTASSSVNGTALQPASDLNCSSSSLGCPGSVGVEEAQQSGEATKGGEKDKDRLAREIREDMDDGGYASLEQILARNGFQVCRIATPPSTEKKVVPTTRVASTSILPSSASTIPTSSSKATPPIQQGADLSKVISRSSSHSTKAQKQKEASRDARNQGTFNTLKNKSSMLSFSGFVSTLWGQSGPSGPSTPHATSFPDATTTTASNKQNTPTTTPIHPHNTTVSDIRTPQYNAVIEEGGGAYVDDSPDGVNTGGKRMDRNEDIKGWLRQTVEATNAYMNEARNAIEAAKLAMRSPEQKKSRVVIGAPSTSKTQNTRATTGSSGIPASGSNSSLDSQRTIGNVEDDDLPLKLHERRQGTQSTLESAILETPTSSPTAAVHPAHPAASSATTTATTQHVLLNSPPYSPPLKQGHQVEPQIVTMEAGYFDSPLLKKKMKRVSEAPRSIHIDGAPAVENTEYPPFKATQTEAGVLDGLENGDAKVVSAEAMLRGTLRYALSESSLRGEGAAAPDTVKKSPAATKPGYRPSIATIFGIPMSFGTSSGSASMSPLEASSNDAAAVSKPVDKKKKEGRNKLQESTTESLSTESASIKTQSTSSTSAKDTSSSNTTNTAPKLLRKTASKHTLRKAASPILSNAIYVLRDEDIVDTSTPTPTPAPVGKGKASTSSSRNSVDMDLTPVKTRPVHLLRGPAPLSKSPSAALDLAKAPVGGATDDKKTTTPSSTNGGTPRQVAHRNPRDSPVGETRVLKKSPTSPLNVKRYPSGPPLALSSSSSAQNGRKVAPKQSSKLVQAQGQAQDTPVKKVEGKKGTQSPGIMDDQNDDAGLWSPSRSRASSRRAPLGDTRGTQPASANATTGQGAVGDGKAKKVEVNSNKPRLKAKESLERILAYKQMQEESTALNEEIPPVPALPPSTTTTATAALPLQDGKNNDMALTQAAMIADLTTSAEQESQAQKTDSDVRPKRSGVHTLKSKQSFTGTLRGILGSAVSGWTDSLPTILNDRSAPVSISRPSSSASSKRVTILPANYSGVAASGDRATARPQGTKSTTRNKSVRRAKSMYITEMETARMKRQEEEQASLFGIGRSGRRRNSLVLPTIIISDHTHD